jgi:hypothetical protein
MEVRFLAADSFAWFAARFSRASRSRPSSEPPVRRLGRRGGENMLLLRVLRLVDELGGLSLGRHPAKSD